MCFYLCACLCVSVCMFAKTDEQKSGELGGGGWGWEGGALEF